MDSFDDIINLPHHVSKRHPQMSLLNRAAQFAPFAALTGYDAAIAESGRQTDAWVEQGEDGNDVMNRKMAHILARLSERPAVAIVYFQPDGRKSGGAYQTISGNVKRIDTYERTLVLTDGTQIPLDGIADITELT